MLCVCILRVLCVYCVYCVCCVYAPCVMCVGGKASETHYLFHPCSAFFFPYLSSPVQPQGQ